MKNPILLHYQICQQQCINLSSDSEQFKYMINQIEKVPGNFCIIQIYLKKHFGPDFLICLSISPQICVILTKYSVYTKCCLKRFKSIIRNYLKGGIESP